MITYGTSDESNGRNNPRTALLVIIISSLLHIVAGAVQWRTGKGRLYFILMCLCLAGNAVVGPVPTAMLLFGNFMEQLWLAAVATGLHAEFFPTGNLDGDSNEGTPLNKP